MDSAPAQGQAEGDIAEVILARVSASSHSKLPLPRALLVMAHPDDEVIAVGARLERFHESRLICVTNGSPHDGADARAKGFASVEDYASARRAELESALHLAGLAPQRFLKALDLGPSAPPIADQAASWRLVDLTRALAAELKSFQPEVVLTHPYEGGHPDHDACAFAAQHAVQLAGASCCIIEAPFYHASASGIETGHFLAGRSREVVCRLSIEEKSKKRELLACFSTQAETLRPFGTEEERYRLAPWYDFTRPPHPGTLHYENFHWGVMGAQFRQLAAAAVAELQIASETLPGATGNA